MSNPEDSTANNPPTTSYPPTNNSNKQTLTIKVGKYAGILTAAFLVTQLLCSFGIEFVP